MGIEIPETTDEVCEEAKRQLKFSVTRGACERDPAKRASLDRIYEVARFYICSHEAKKLSAVPLGQR